MKSLKPIIFCILFTILFLGLQIVSGIAIVLINIPSELNASTIESVINDQTLVIHIVSVLIFFAIVMLYRKITKNKIWDEKQADTRPNLWIVSLILALSYSMAWGMITINHQFENMTMIQNGIDHYSKNSPVLGYLIMVVSVYILAPIGEELLCRRIMINTLRKKYSALISILISSLIFGIMHVFAGGITLSIGSLIMGLILGFIYVYTGGNFWIAVASHIIANCADFLLPLISENIYIPFVIVLIFISAVSIIYIKRSSLNTRYI